MKVLKRKVQTFAQSNRDRGLLLNGPLKAQKGSASPAPGSYNTIDHHSMFGKVASKIANRSPVRAQKSMGTASREVSWTRYSSINAGIYSNLH